MTRKDYILLAQALNGAYPLAENNTPATAWENCYLAIAAALSQDNPSFNKARFIAAVKGA